MFINIVCIIGILSCIVSILLSLYGILEQSYEISHEILAKLLYYIYKMLCGTWRKTGGSSGNPGPSPAGGGGKPPGKGPNGNGLPNKGGTDKPDVPSLDMEEQEEQDPDIKAWKTSFGKTDYDDSQDYCGISQGLAG